MTRIEQFPERRAGEIGLLCGAEFAAVAEHELRRCIRVGEFCSLLWLRIDHRGPKRLEVAHIDASELRALAQLIALELRASDVVSVASECEVVVLLPSADNAQSLVVLDHLRSGILEFAEGAHSRLFTRVGIATVDPSQPACSFDELLERARAALA
jgi:GGDEF domain-containing protein